MKEENPPDHSDLSEEVHQTTKISSDENVNTKGPIMRARSLSMTPSMLSAATNWNEVSKCSKNKVRAKSMMIPSTISLLPPDFPDSGSKESVNSRVKMKSFSADDAGTELTESKVIILPMEKQIETSYPKFYRNCHPDMPVSPTDSLPDKSM